MRVCLECRPRAAQYAEYFVLENSPAVPGMKECWRHRLQALRRELGSDNAPVLENLLIQHTALCWLNLSLTEMRYSAVFCGCEAVNNLNCRYLLGKTADSRSKTVYASV